MAPLHERLQAILALCPTASGYVSGELRTSNRIEASARFDLTNEDLREIVAKEREPAAEREKATKGLACIQKSIQKVEALTARAEKAEARVKELEASAEPFAWALVYSEDGRVGLSLNEDATRGLAAGGYGEAIPLYRHPPKTAGEPVAWRNDYEAGVGEKRRFYATDRDEAQYVSPHGKLTPLYEAPRPTAHGAEKEEFGYRDVSNRRCPLVFTDDGDGRVIGSLADAQAAVSHFSGTKLEIVRIIPADAPVIDVGTLREIAADLVRAGGGGDRVVASSIRIAIGDEKAEG